MNYGVFPGCDMELRERSGKHYPLGLFHVSGIRTLDVRGLDGNGPSWGYL